jgi:hypothetical protein
MSELKVGEFSLAVLSLSIAWLSSNNYNFGFGAIRLLLRTANTDVICMKAAASTQRTRYLRYKSTTAALSGRLVIIGQQVHTIWLAEPELSLDGLNHAYWVP